MLDLSSVTLGILGGMGPAATAHFQQLLVAELNRSGFVTDAAFPRIITLSLPLRGWDHRGAQDKTLVATQVRQGVNWLESFGAKVIAVPCNSVHEFVDSSVVVNIIDATLAKCIDAKVIGVLCSRQSRESKLYEQKCSGQKFIYLRGQNIIDDIIARTLTGERPRISRYIRELYRFGANVVVLGCTELSLCSRSYNPGVVVDSSQALAEAVVRQALQ